MNRNLLFFMGAMAYCCALTAPTAMAQDQPQADPQITALPTANAYQISWPGVAGRLYYLQFTTSLDGWTSNDPEIWTCAPAVFLGDGSTVTAGFSSTVPRSFVRLKYSLATHYTEGDHGDADGDGLSNIDEVSIHLTEPLLADTDNDGLSDSDEITRGTNPKITDTDNDGLSDSKEVTRGTNPLQFNVPAITIEHAWREAVIYHFNLNCPDPHTRLYRNLAATAPSGTLATRSLSPFDLSNSQHVNTLDPYVEVSNAWAAANGVPAFTPYVQNWGGWVPYNPQAHKLEGILRRDYTGGYLSPTQLQERLAELSITDNTLPTDTEAYSRSIYYGTDRDVRLKTEWPVPYTIARSFIRIDREGTAPASNLNNVTWTDTGYSTVTLTIPAGQTYSTPNPAGIWTADTRLLSRPDKLSANPSSQPFFTTARAERRFVLLPIDFKTYPDTEAGPDKAHRKNLKTRQDETAKHGTGWEKVVCKIWDASPGKVNLIDYLDGGPGNHSTYENLVKWRVNGTEQTSHELSLGEDKPDPDKHTHFYVQVMPKNGGDTLDRLIITVVPPETKTNFDNWYAAESTAAGKAWFAECPRMPSSLEVTPLQSPDRLFSPRIWRDPEAINTYFHPNGYYELRAKKTPGGHGHQVTFSDTGALILTGVSAGTADKEAAWPEQWYSYHVDADVTPFMWALQLDGNPCDQATTTLTMPMLHEGAFIKKYMECRPPEPNAKPRFAPGGTP